MRTIDENALSAKNSDADLEKFVKKNEGFIIKTASKAVGGFITKSSEQWPIALAAFCEAVGSYSAEKGGFLSFAELVIKRRLIDYVKSQSRFRNEIPVDPYNFECDSSEDFEDRQVSYAEVARLSYTPNSDIRLEIEAVSEVLTGYGISFSDLVGVSPKAEKTRRSCARAIVAFIKNPELLSEMREKKTLPIKKLKFLSGTPQKILERHRKYIIAGTEIISGDYPCLAEYIKFVREELKQS